MRIGRAWTSKNIDYTLRRHSMDSICQSRKGRLYLFVVDHLEEFDPLLFFYLIVTTIKIMSFDILIRSIRWTFFLSPSPSPFMFNIILYISYHEYRSFISIEISTGRWRELLIRLEEFLIYLVRRNETICCLIGFGIGVGCCVLYRLISNLFTPSSSIVSKRNVSDNKKISSDQN